MKPGDLLKDPDRKRRYNEWIFSMIAREYDLITRPLSLWRDAAWKRHMMDMLPARDAARCVDLACGTGDICALLSRKYPDGLIVGVDLTARILDLARSRHLDTRIHFVRQDMVDLGFRDASVDIVTGSYALRNAPDLDSALKEVCRILKPGGLAAFLDFSKPTRRLPQVINYWILKTWGGLWGLALHGKPEVYGYIADSLQLFPDRDELRAVLQRNGLNVLRSRLFFFGMIEVIVATRLTADGSPLSE